MSLFCLCYSVPNNLFDLFGVVFVVGMVTSKVGKRFAFKGLKALSEILIRYSLS